MKCCNCFTLLVLFIILYLQPSVESSSTDSFNMRISNTSHSINVSWEKPDKTKSDMCYRTQLQFRRHCESSWQSVDDIAGFSFKLSFPDMKNYVFRIRARLYCIDGNWSNWSLEKYWRNNTGPCFKETPSYRIKNYLLVTALPVAVLLIIFIISQKRIRRLVLPIIPDPKNTQERILNIEQCQGFISFSQVCEECKIAEIEVAYQRQEESSEVINEQSLPKLVDAESHDLNLCSNSSMYCVYSPDSAGHNIAPPCCHTMPGYIVL